MSSCLSSTRRIPGTLIAFAVVADWHTGSVYSQQPVSAKPMATNREEGT